LALDTAQSALLAGAIINPRLHSPARPTARLLARQQLILSRMGQGRRQPEPVAAVAAEPLVVDESLQQEEFGYPLADESAPLIDDVLVELEPTTAPPDTAPVLTPAPFPSP